MGREPFSDDSMNATYRALCKHGLADVTMEDIAAESEKSKSALHYHFESKHDLLVAFLDFLLASFTDRLDAIDEETPHDRLLETIDTVLGPATDGSDREFKTAILELKAQGPYDEEFRERLCEFDRALHAHVANILVAGVETGDFRADLDPEETAGFFVTVCNGAQTRSVAVGHPVEQTGQALERYIASHVRAAAADTGQTR